MAALFRTKVESRSGTAPALAARPSVAAATADAAAGLEATIDLLARVHAGDQSAWDVLVNRVWRPLKQLGHSRLPQYARSLTDTDDVVQDAIVSTMKRLRHFDCQSRGALLAYLRRAVLNRIVDEARKCARRGTAETLGEDRADKGPSPLDYVLSKEEEQRFHAAVARLRPRDRQLILLRVKEHLTYAEVAERLGMTSPDAARIASMRALWRFAGALKHL